MEKKIGILTQNNVSRSFVRKTPFLPKIGEKNRRK
jgi:hypothetical protein